MANNIWDNSDADNNGNVAANWSLGRVPIAGDVMVFDSASTNDNCTFSGSVSCDGLAFLNTYTGTVDFNDHAMTFGINGLIGTNGGSATVDCGTSTITCSGTFNNSAIGTWTRATSMLVASGTSKTIIAPFATRLHNLTVSGTISASGQVDCAAMSITGSYTNSIGSATVVRSGLTLNGTTLTGTGSIDITGDIVRTAGTWSIATTVQSGSGSLGPATYTTTFNFRKAFSVGTVTKVLSAGTYVFDGDFVIDSNVTAQEFQIDLATNNPDIQFNGDVTLTESVGTINLVEGTGIITFGGTTEYADNTAAIQILGDVDADGTSLKLLTEMECDDFTLTAGTVDIDANDLDISGNYTQAAGTTIQDTTGGGEVIIAGALDINGISGTPCVWNGPDVNLTGAGDADWTTITNSATVVVTDIDATFNCTDGGGNGAGWDFGLAAPTDGVARLIFLTGEAA